MTERLPIPSLHELAKKDLERQIANGNIVDGTRALRQVEAYEAARVENEKAGGKVLALTELQNKYLWLVEGKEYS